jgi:hypothetical protein
VLKYSRCCDLPSRKKSNAGDVRVSGVIVIFAGRSTASAEPAIFLTLGWSLVLEEGRIAHDIDVGIARPRQRGAARLWPGKRDFA